MSISVSKKTQRIEWLDVAKGIAILLMVGGHSSLPARAQNWIYSFHMPLFFIASGYATAWVHDSFKSYARKKALGLGRQYLIYSLVIIGLFMLLGLSDGCPVKLFGGWGDYALWFVPVLFGALLLAHLGLNHGCRVKYICFIIFPLISASLSYFRVQIPWNLGAVPLAAFFVMSGAEARKYSSKIERVTWLSILASLLVMIVVAEQWHLVMARNICNPVILIAAGALAGTLLVAQLSVLINRYLPRTSSALMAIGRETFLILAFSQLLIIAFNVYLPVNSIVKYLLLVIALIILKYIKDFIVEIWKVHLKLK